MDHYCDSYLTNELLKSYTAAHRYARPLDLLLTITRSIMQIKMIIRFLT